MVAANREQARILALASRVWLQRNRVIAGQLSKPLLEVGHHDHVSLGVLQRGEGVQATEFFPGDSFHLCGGVELHGAAAQWNHPAVQRVVLVRERLEVAHHGGLRAVRVEDRVVQVAALAHHCLRQCHRTGSSQVVTQLKSLSQSLLERALQQTGVLTDCRLVQRERNSIRVNQVDEQIVRCCLGNHGCCFPGEAHLKRVKELGVHDIVPRLDQSVTKTSGLLSNTLGDCLQAIRAVINSKHASHHGEEHLSGADVAGRLVPADVLFSGLQSQAIRGVAIGVFGDADQATRHLTLEAIADREITSVGTSKAKGNTKALRCSHRNVSAEFAGRRDESERQQISGDHSEATMGVRLGDRLSRVDNPA